MNQDIKFCISCSNLIPNGEELCSISEELCFTCRQPFTTENHFSECQSCFFSKTTPRVICSICKFSFSSQSKLNPPNCLSHSYCPTCINNKANTLYKFVDSRGKFSVLNLTGTFCNSCELYFESHFNTYNPPNCSFCKSFAIPNFICSLHNYCEKCIDFIVKNKKAVFYNKITECSNCSGIFGLDETVAIRRLSEIYKKDQNKPQRIMMEVEINPILSSNRPEDLASDLNINLEELKIEEDVRVLNWIPENFKVQISLRDLNEFEIIKKDLDRGGIEEKEVCFGCKREFKTSVYGKCGHGICELCIFFYTYLPVFKKFYKLQGLPENKVVYFCKCKDELEIYHPIMKILKYVEDVVEGSSIKTIGSIYQEFLFINEHRDIFIKYKNYFEGLSCVFQICPNCRLPCFLVNTKLICPWEATHINFS